MTTLMASLMEQDNNVTFGAVTSNQSLKSHEHGNMTPAEMLDELNARYATTLIPFTILLGLFGVIGIVGNILVFIVYGWGQKFKDKKFRYYVLTLAVIDFVTCLTLIPAEMVKHMSYFNFTEHVLCKMKCFFNVFAASSAFYCLTLIAIDRFIMICHPLLFAKVPAFSNGLARKLCFLMIILAVLTAIPSAILCGITPHVIRDVTGHVITVSLCESDPYYAHSVQRYVYRFILCGLQTLVSLVMIVLYAKIGHAVMKVIKLRDEKENELKTRSMQSLHRHYTEREHHCTEHPDVTNCRHHHHTHMPSNIKLLFLVTLVFIVTFLFYMVLSWVDQTTLTPVQFLFFSMAFRLYFVHSIINPILYMKMDKYFRKRCMELVRSIFRCRSNRY